MACVNEIPRSLSSDHWQGHFLCGVSAGEEQSDKPGLSGPWSRRRIGFVGSVATASCCISGAAE